VSRGGGSVGVGRQVMELCGSIVRALWHGAPPASWMLPIAATASVYVFSMMYFALTTSAGRPVGDQSGTAVSYFAVLSLMNLHGGQDDEHPTYRLGLVIPRFRRHFVFRSIS
jgi:hypothetical protein